ncbi:glycosyltransferase [Nocardioides sp. W3-2-3]|uniref:glycosyltransferase n=1 Tax=Nocardioides convexus TaxID=2712224 RepID=UPI0024184DEE|nr:glycosyltransferase [Nocardioides convexus]NHA00950.1 glycosyltransferase [Nocardioides convexus]
MILGSAAVDLAALVLCVLFLAYVLAILVPFLRRRPEPAGDARDLDVHLILPCLDEEVVIARTVARLRHDHPTAHLWCVDDDSADATGTILAGLAAADDHVHLVSRRAPEARQGKGAALNAAWRLIKAWLATHDPSYDAAKVVIGVVDADGRLAPDALDVIAGPGGFGDPRVGAVQVQVRMMNRGLAGRPDAGDPAAETRLGRLLVTLQDLEFRTVIAAMQHLRHRIGSAGMGGNGQFTRLVVLDAIAAENDTPWHGALLEDFETRPARAARGLGQPLLRRHLGRPGGPAAGAPAHPPAGTVGAGRHAVREVLPAGAAQQADLDALGGGDLLLPDDPVDPADRDRRLHGLDRDPRLLGADPPDRRDGLVPGGCLGPDPAGGGLRHRPARGVGPGLPAALRADPVAPCRRRPRPRLLGLHLPDARLRVDRVLPGPAVPARLGQDQPRARSQHPGRRTRRLLDVRRQQGSGDPVKETNMSRVPGLRGLTHGLRIVSAAAALTLLSAGAAQAATVSQAEASAIQIAALTVPLIPDSNAANDGSTPKVTRLPRRPDPTVPRRHADQHRSLRPDGRCP